MIFRLLTGFLIVFVGTSILGGIFAGGGGMASTTLDSDITANATFVPASSTSLFSTQDVLTIESENILYSSKNSTGFVVSQRGYGDTTAVAHTSGRTIYTEESGVINSALGFDVGLEIESGGTWALVQLPIRFFTTTLPHLAVLNVNFLSQGALQYIGIFWICAGIGLLICLAIQLAPIAVSLISGLFGFLRR